MKNSFMLFSSKLTKYETDKKTPDDHSSPSKKKSTSSLLNFPLFS